MEPRIAVGLRHQPSMMSRTQVRIDRNGRVRLEGRP